MSSTDHEPGPLHVEVLGPLRALGREGEELTPRGSLQQRLLAFLVLRRGRVVSPGSLADVLWPDQRPADPVAALHNHISRLRQGMPVDLVQSVGEGYRLDPVLVEVDTDVLGSLLASDPTTDPRGVTALEGILERWAGPAYPELEEVDEARLESVRLEELRTRAREWRAEARLARGETVGLLAELTDLCDADPFRERPRSLLMTALAATGRQAEALRAYDDFRRLLADELGTEPSPALADQHLRLLSGAGTGWTPTTALPAPATSIIGRTELATDVVGQVGSARLLSLVGPGGVGKTRLLLEVGRLLVAADPDRPVVLVELAAADAGSVVEVVATALGIDARPGTPLAEHVTRMLATAHLVLLLDNCEHVLDPAASLVERLLARCPDVHVVASSRERLRVVGEQVRPVPTLPTDAGSTGSAVELFLDRARAVVPDFDPPVADLAVVEEIVRRLDGLPLAIELAAARLLTHDLDQIAAGLDRRFSLLSSGSRTSQRHASLGAAVSWSFGLLEPGLQHAFADLSVFAGAFSTADAAAVCELDEERFDVVLAELVERSLVMRAPGRRHFLLETLRAFGREQLTETGRLDEVAGRHARHFLRVAEEADAELLQPGGQVILQLDGAVAELRTALTWLVHHDRPRAAELVSHLLDYGIVRLRPDVLAWADKVVGAGLQESTPAAARVRAMAAYAAWMRGDLDAMATAAESALATSRRTDPPVPIAITIMGTSALVRGRLEEAADWYRQAVEAADPEDQAHRLLSSSSRLLALGYAGDPRVVDLAETLLDDIGELETPYAAYAWYCAGEAVLAADPDRARARLERAHQLAEASHASFVTGLAGATLASLDAREGDPVAAADAFRRLLLQWRRAGMWSTQWTMLRSVAGLLARLGRHHEAAVLEGAVRGTTEGHEIFGEDAERLRALGSLLRASLGPEAYEEARRHGAELDGEGVVEFALRAL